MTYHRSRVDKTPFIARMIDEDTAEYFAAHLQEWVVSDRIAAEIEFSGDWYGITEAEALKIVRELSRQTA